MGIYGWVSSRGPAVSWEPQSGNLRVGIFQGTFCFLGATEREFMGGYLSRDLLFPGSHRAGIYGWVSFI